MRDARLALRLIQQMAGRRARIGGERRDNRPQVEIAVADVEQHGAIRCELAMIEGEGFPGQQMQRDRVGTERVDNDQVVGTVRHRAEGQARIAEHNARIVAAVFEKMEERSEEHTSELQSRRDLVCRLLLEKKNIKKNHNILLQKLQIVLILYHTF